ncbi:50S ribosomal protein L11 methyltransferase [Algoriphagus sediminis]|uniref:Ribosomal protein L11 methyltransferase n=1 Tax=Algoriphagus sediminis TaxID=3057113 RepID=A0ABT7YCR4_9BACT|nr:50S ribosomal protein L11 methyltransferase [Algoriphagus sediminis]MDN3204282.1 50S ribosomal protein L11 methyltransferase [Algoriphagus sediminis]
MDYLEFKISCSEEFREILMAELSDIGFDSFLETDQGIDAYILSDDFDGRRFEDLVNQYKDLADLIIEEGKLEKKNWNEEWEKNYDPISVDDLVYVRASFHKPLEGYQHEILINPKMSFGTGHHATTYLMLKHQGELAKEHEGKRVLDVGSGTGILAIMAHQLGAAKIEAFDIDEWSVENGNENFELNGLPVTMGHGTIRDIKLTGPFDIILANINKNILLDEMEIYVSLLSSKGYLLLSGFYDSDIKDLSKKATELGLKLIKTGLKDSWAAIIFQKP